jgi:hypothetical protein
MKHLDYEKLDKILTVLFEKRGQGRVNVPNCYKRIAQDDADFDELGYLIYCHDLKSLGLAECYNGSNTEMRILPLGQTVVENGGWLRYQNIEKERQRLEYDLRIREVEASEKASKSAKSSAKAAWVASIVSVLALLISVYQYYTNQQINGELELLKKRMMKVAIQQKSQAKSKELQHSGKVLKAK